MLASPHFLILKFNFLSAVLHFLNYSPAWLTVFNSRHFRNNLIQVVTGWGLKCREFLVAHQLLHPHQLSDRQHVPVINVSRAGRGSAPAIPNKVFSFMREPSKGSRLMLQTCVQ